MSELTIGILETGRPPKELTPEFPDYPTMVADWLCLPDADFRTYAVLDDELPTDPAECDLWVITGSKSAVYEDHAWIPALEAFVRELRNTGGLMVGICFGHQIIAQALGGEVVKSDKGWGLGVHGYAPIDWPEALGPAPESIRLQAYHQDQVARPPEGARTVATSDFCEHAALWYPGFALTVQGHPEFSTRYVRALLEFRRGTVLPEHAVDDARNTMAQTTRADLAALIRERFKSI